MQTIMVVDDMAIFRDPIAASLRLAGYKTVCAADGKEALRLLPDAKPSAILLDLSMPVMDGLSFLGALRAMPSMRDVPVIVLTALAEKETILKAGRLGVHGYLLKSRFSLKELLERVRKCLNDPTDTAVAGAADGPAASTMAAPAVHIGVTSPCPKPQPADLQGLMTREECIRRTRDAMEAKTLSGVVGQVISLASSPRANLADLADLIGKDSILSARVLQAANSAAYASSRGVVSCLGDAVRHIGCSTIRNIAATVGVFDAMPEGSPDGFNPIRCWQHSFGVATLCERLASGLDDVTTGCAYVAGLCHDLGDILFHTHFADEYRQILDAQAQTGLSSAIVERRMLGVTRGELSMVILKSLGLPSSIQKPIELFHGTQLLRGDGSHRLARLLRLAEAFANAVLLAATPSAQAAPLGKAESQLGPQKGLPELPDADTLRSEVFCMTGMLSRLNPREQSQLLKPMFARAQVNLTLVRDPALLEIDPITLLFQSMANVRLADHLRDDPEDDEQGLVVVSRTPVVSGLTAADIQKRLAARAVPLLWIVQQSSKSPVPAGDSPTPAGTSISLQAAADFVARCGSERANVAA